MSGLGKGTGLLKKGWGKAMGWSELEGYWAFRLEWGRRAGWVNGNPGRYLHVHTVHIRNKQVGYEATQEDFTVKCSPWTIRSLDDLSLIDVSQPWAAHRRWVIITAARRNLGLPISLT
jgi:hypothetical protein